MNRRKLLFIIGTRPEAIKLAPIILAFQRKGIESRIVLTGQHPELAHKTLSHFNLKPDECLTTFTGGQSTVQFSGRLLLEFVKLAEDWRNSITFVQGDTTSAIMGAYATKLLGSRVIHVEAGLRSHHSEPFPEEMNRKLISQIAEIHFCPTRGNYLNLRQEGVKDETIHVVGNTVIDAMHYFQIRKRELHSNQPLVLITLHRSENQGNVIQAVTKKVACLANELFRNLDWNFIKHPNPRVQASYYQQSAIQNNMHFIEPVEYPDMLRYMQKAKLLITDSGGLQEEATSLGLPTLILRKTTERPEALESGCCVLVKDVNVQLEPLVRDLLSERSDRYRSMSHPNGVFGSGNSAEKIVEIVLQSL